MFQNRARTLSLRALFCTLLLHSNQSAWTQFTTIIDAPPQAVPASIGSDTQLNLFSGGVTPAVFAAGASNGTSTNVEVNVLGGSVFSNSSAYGGSTINLSSGAIGQVFTAHSNSVLNISGGTVGRLLRAQSGSQVNLSGGSIGDDFESFSGSVVNVTGGSIEDDFRASGEVNLSGGFIRPSFVARSGSTLNVSGGLAHSLSASGGSLVNIFGGSVGLSNGSDSLTALSGSTVNISGGTIGDGADFRGGSIGQISGGVFGDNFIAGGVGGLVTLRGGEFLLNGVPIGNTASLDLPTQWTLSGVLENGTPFVFTNRENNRDSLLRRDIIADNRLALAVVPLAPIGAATIHLPGDPRPDGIRSGQTLSLGAGGALGNNFSAGPGSVVRMEASTSRIGTNFEASGAQVDVFGGFIDERFDAFGDSVVNVHAGQIYDEFELFDNSELNVSGGTIGRFFQAYDGTTVNASGGTFIGSTTVNGGSEFNLSGGAIGDLFTVKEQGHFNISGGEFYLDGVPLNVAGTVPLDIPGGSVLSGTLGDGTPFAFSSLDGDVIADGALSLTAQSLPPIGPPLITVPGDPVPLGIRSGQTLIVNGGPLASGLGIFNAGLGSSLVVNGSISSGLEAVGADVEIHGGLVAGIEAYTGTSVTISGGEVRGIQAYSGSDWVISGGEVFDNNIDVFAGAEVTLLGGEFFLDGLPIAGLTNPGDSIILATRGSTNLTGRLSDGRPIGIILNEFNTGSDYVDSDAILRLTLTPGAPNIPEPSTFVLASLTCLMLIGRKPACKHC
jgi:hypothetical protein